MTYLDDDGVDSAELDAEAVAAIEAIDRLEDSLNSGGVIARLLLDAKKTSDAARLALVTVEPTDSRQIMKLQWMVGRFDELMYWINDVKEAAEAALEDFTESDLALVRRLIKGEPDIKDA